MLSIAADTRIFIASGATDMRKGFDGLCGLVISVLEKDPLSGQLFLFVNRRRDRLKILCGASTRFACSFGTIGAVTWPVRRLLLGGRWLLSATE